MEDIKEEFPQVKWVSVNTHADTEGLAAQYKVAVVPTLVVLRDGVEIGRHSGATVGIYYSLIRKAITYQK
jgi:acid phosphatase family membrane protein YuiD